MDEPKQKFIAVRAIREVEITDSGGHSLSISRVHGDSVTPLFSCLSTSLVRLSRICETLRCKR